MKEKEKTGGVAKKRKSDEETTITQVRLPSSLWKAVRHEAVDMDASANTAVISLLAEALEVRRARTRNAEFQTEEPVLQTS